MRAAPHEHFTSLSHSNAHSYLLPSASPLPSPPLTLLWWSRSQPKPQPLEDLVISTENVGVTVTSGSALISVIILVPSDTDAVTIKAAAESNVGTAQQASQFFGVPVATPPNAIVFGSSQITTREMAQTGFALNLIGAGVITLGCLLWL